MEKRDLVLGDGEDIAGRVELLGGGGVIDVGNVDRAKARS